MDGIRNVLRMQMLKHILNGWKLKCGGIHFYVINGAPKYYYCCYCYYGAGIAQSVSCLTINLTTRV